MKPNSASPFLTFVLGAASAALAGAHPQSAPQSVAPLPPQQLDEVDGGEGRSALAQLDDSVPLPIPAKVSTGADGDVVVQPASGDPDFLAFVAGAYHPAADERIDPALLAQLRSRYDDGRPTQSTYAFVMFSKRMTPARVAQLEALGCRALGFHPHYCMKVAVPAASVELVAALDFVRWIGAPKSWQKLHTRLPSELELAQGDAIDVYVDVYESDLCADSSSEPFGTLAAYAPGGVVDEGGVDTRGVRWTSNGWQQHALEAAGLEVLEYVDRIHAFRARLHPAALEAVVALDFVQFVEPDLPDRISHDESMPGCLLDKTRAAYDGGSDLIALVGQIDSGIDLAHTMLDHFSSVGWDTTSEGGASIDGCESGSGIAGTILGLPLASNEGVTGCAPGLGGSPTSRYRNVKKFDSSCVSSSTSLSSLFSHMRSNFTDGSGNVSPKPHVVNCSWGAAAVAGSPYVGSEANARTVDSEVWDNSQFYVFSAGNEGVLGASGIRLEGSAKNAFTVGMLQDYAINGRDPGALYPTSSLGPTGDGRWKPNVAAPGRWIESADANTGSGYKLLEGSSLAAAHVTGLAAQICDHTSAYRYAPHRLASLLMATSIPDQDAQLTTQPGISDAHLNSYGAGRINAANTLFVYSGETKRANWGGTLNPGIFGFDDFVVDAGCVRLIVCMTYHEDQCSAGAANALVSDWDLYLDSPQNGIDPAGNTGEYTAQQSSVNNTEMRTFSTPQTGTWRWKVFPTSATTTARYSVTVHQIFADTTPDGTLTVTADDLFVKPNDDVEITATATNPGYFASYVFLDSTTSGDSLQASTTTLEDGLVTDLMDNFSDGEDVLLGTIRIGAARTAKWTTRWATEGVKNFEVEARSDNWTDETHDLDITVDGTPPTQVFNLHSTSHTQNVWSNDPNLQLAWNPAIDTLSGLDGYSRTFGQNAAIPPDQVKDMGPVTSLSVNLTDGNWAFAIKAVDKCDNWFAGYSAVGPFKIDTTAPLGPTNLISTSHTANVPSCNELVQVQWTAATDGGSGLEGYIVAVNGVALFQPGGAPNVAPNVTSYLANVGSTTSARFVHVRSKDLAGNFGPTAHFGPLYIDANSVSTYCTAKVNSLGCLPAMATSGQPDLSDGTFVVTCSNVLNNKNGLLFWGATPAAAPFQGGFKCVAAPTLRTPIQGSGGSLSGNDCTGSYSFTWTTSYLNSVGLSAGDTVYCQFWMRDPPSPSTTGLSNGVEFTVCD